ncbi:MAG TPA: biotin--[acetyl-CoA-carboxylase] ligase [Nitrospirota bacterium]|nr:biotin--[acetyl-CoA-carboxylase] ligase [Nitrospirota bacterium]
MYKEKILNILRASRSAFLSGEELARKIGVSRTMVWKHIKALKRDGFGIDAVPSQGYRIISEPDLLRQNEIKTGLKTRVIGKEIHIYPEISSTNTRAMEMASDNAHAGTVVIAETQTGGKGRLGRKWISPKGNLYFSVILRPEIPLHKAPLITLMGAVAVASAIRKACNVHAVIKWPNDVLISGKKVCGLLTEMSAEQDRIRHIVLGIGVDVNMDLDVLPTDVRMMTTSLLSETNKKINRTALLREILRELDHWYQVFLHDSADMLKAWENLNMTIGSRIAVSGAGDVLEGLAQGVDTEGRLIVKLDDGTTRTVAAGDVTIVKR